MKLIFKFIILLLIICSSSLSAFNKKKVLILHSYHESFKWTNDINRGIKSAIKDKNFNIDFYVEYMDTKRYIDKEHYKNLFSSYLYKYNSIKFDVIIASDNNAFNFLKNHGQKLFKDTPRILCGINHLKKEDIQNLPNFRGINEDSDIKRNFDLILKLHPNTKNIYLITDMTTTGKEIKKEVQKVIFNYPNKKVNFSIIDDISIEKLKSITRNLPQDSAILFSIFFRDKKDNFFEYNEVSKIISENTTTPIYSLWDFSLENGVIGGFLASGYFQGRTAGLMAKKVLDGKNFKSIQNMYRSPNQYMFDYKKINAYKIDKKLLPKSSFLINKEQTFIDKYLKEILFLITVFLSMSIFIMLLLVNIRKKEKAEKEIVKQLKFQQDLIDNVNTPIYYKDINKVFRGCNKAFETLIGKSREDIIGQTSYELLPKERAKFFIQKDDEILENKTPQKHETYYEFKGQKRKDIILYKNVFYDENKVHGVIGSIFDVTELKRVSNELNELNKNLEKEIKIRTKELEDSNIELKEQKNLIDTLVNAIPDIVWMKDTNGVFVYCNKRFSEVFGTNREKIIGKTDHDYFDKVLADFFVMHDRKAMKEDIPLMNYEVVPFADGHEEYTQTIKTAIKDHSGKVIGTLGVGRNLTNEQKQKERLEATNKELQETVENLEQTQEQLVQSEKMASLGSLVAGVAHEINTPIGIGLTGSSHFVTEVKKLSNSYKNDQMTEKTFTEFLASSESIAKLINTNLEKTAQLVKSFKQVAVDQTSDIKRQINLKDYINEILFSLNNVTKKKRVRMNLLCDDNLKIKTFPGSISQVITNLVINSIYHAFNDKKEGIIDIKISYNKGEVTLIYEDNGKGIKKENLNKIFEPFFTTNRENGGTGLGLNIIYNIIVNTLKGTIKCESRENIGVKFTITFKVQDEV